ncbi:MAG: acyl carrier protein [Alphaproteobacteria bacterium]|nr:acyl carrier protein [Alphaproteobacteria bacterium]
MRFSRDSLRRWFAEEQGLDMAPIADDTPLFSSGLLDSLAMVDLLTFVEDSAGIRVRWTELTLERIDSVAAILAFVEAKRGG